MIVLKNSLAQSHELIARAVKPGDTVIDATAGNGRDTAFLAGLVGKSGRVFSFDIQKPAISNTKDYLNGLNLIDRVILINDSHANIDKYVISKVRAVMFNLGYLPGGDHKIGTKADSTITAVDKAIELLIPGGLITIVVYYGGDSGFEEKEIFLKYITQLDPLKCAVLQSGFVNLPNCPPILVCIEKLNIL